MFIEVTNAYSGNTLLLPLDKIMISNDGNSIGRARIYELGIEDDDYSGFEVYESYNDLMEAIEKHTNIIRT